MTSHPTIPRLPVMTAPNTQADIATDNVASNDTATDNVASDNIATHNVASDNIATHNVASDDIATDTGATPRTRNAAQDGWPELLPGWVWLCGAGPGDPGLLTLHGLNALQQADVIVYDALVGEGILQWAPQAQHIYAGKRGGKPSPKQRDISLKLIELSRQGMRVVRLKGGDPFIFGRGGEEAQTLIKHNVHIRVIPGITAGIGGMAYAGIPLTHRDINQSVTFVTGHDQTGQTPNKLNWHAIAQGSQVIVIYMGMKHIERIAKDLIAGGRRPDEAVAIVRSATTANQDVLQTTLANASADIKKHNFDPPSVICIGQVVHLAGVLNWHTGTHASTRTSAGTGTSALTAQGAAGTSAGIGAGTGTSADTPTARGAGSDAARSSNTSADIAADVGNKTLSTSADIGAGIASKALSTSADIGAGIASKALSTGIDTHADTQASGRHTTHDTETTGKDANVPMRGKAANAPKGKGDDKNPHAPNAAPHHPLSGVDAGQTTAKSGLLSTSGLSKA